MKWTPRILLIVGFGLWILLGFDFVRGMARYRRGAAEARFIEVPLGSSSHWAETTFTPAPDEQELTLDRLGYKGDWQSVPHDRGWVEIEVRDARGEAMYRGSEWIAAGAAIADGPQYLHTISDPVKGPARLRLRVTRPDPANSKAKVRVYVNGMSGPQPGFAEYYEIRSASIWGSSALVAVGAAMLAIAALRKKAVGAQ